MRLARENIFTLPNALTLVRVPLAGLVWVDPSSRPWLFAVMASAAASDMLDGRVARAIRARRLTRGHDAGRIAEAHAVGAWLDPLCDKLFVLSVVAAVAVVYQPSMVDLLLIAVREIILIPFVLAYALSPRTRGRVRFDFRAGVLGKATTVAQFAAIISIVVWPGVTQVLAVAAALVGLAAGVDYLWRAVTMARVAAAPGPLSYERWMEIQAELRARARARRL
jgi:cardiolipin synthase (CMP-forming)